MWTRTSRFAAANAAALVAPGAHVVGGCCRVRPADIAALAYVVETPGPL
jgi:homocysteine S-methyltransferase